MSKLQLNSVSTCWENNKQNVKVLSHEHWIHPHAARGQWAPTSSLASEIRLTIHAWMVSQIQMFWDQKLSKLYNSGVRVITNEKVWNLDTNSKVYWNDAISIVWSNRFQGAFGNSIQSTREVDQWARFLCLWTKILSDFLHQTDIKSLNSGKSLNNLIPDNWTSLKLDWWMYLFYRDFMEFSETLDIRKVY